MTNSLTTDVDPLQDWERITAGRYALLSPPGWTLIPEDLGAKLILLSPDASIDEFRPNLNLVERPGGALDPEVHLAVQQDELTHFTDALVIDAERTELAQRVATRVLVTYRSDDTELTLEQWQVGLGDVLLTVSATAATSHYVEVSEILSAMVESLRIDG